MKCEIVTKIDNPLLKRVEIAGNITFNAATPSNKDIKKELAAQMKSKEENVQVKNIYTAFGESTANFSAYVYKSEEDLKKYTPVTKAMKDAVKKAAEEAKKAAEEAKAEKPAEEKKEEKPAEEKKEEAPAEEKKEAKPAEEKKEEKPAEEKKE